MRPHTMSSLENPTFESAVRACASHREVSRRFGNWKPVSLRFPGEVEATPARGLGAVQWLRVSPFLGLHALCFLALWVGVSPAAGIVCAASYVLRMFAITGFYHRYFSHRAFKTSRFMQFVFAAWGGTSRAARSVVVGCASPSAPRAFRSGSRCAFADPLGFLLEPHGLVHDEREPRHRLRPHPWTSRASPSCGSSIAMTG